MGVISTRAPGTVTWPSSPRRARIKSIQRGSIAKPTTTALTATATITAVDTTKAILEWLGCTSVSSLSVTAAWMRVALTDSTTVTATREGTTSSSSLPAVGFQVTEWEEVV